MAYDHQFIDGFDKYGPIGYVDIVTLIDDGEWTSLTGQYSLSVVASLLGSGTALQVGSSGGASNIVLIKTLPANYARVVGGLHIRPDDLAKHKGMQFRDGASDQFWLGIEAATGRIQTRRGGPSSAIIATSTESIGVGAIACLEWDITFHNTTGIIKVWINGVLTSLNLTAQDTCATANNYYNGFGFADLAASGISSNTVDHLYLWNFLAAGGAETPALTNPTIESQFGSGDDTVAWTKNAGVLGTVSRTTTTTNAPAAGSLVLRPFTPPANCTINSVSFLPQATLSTAKYKAVIYSNSAGAPNALLSSGTEIVGTTAGTFATGNLVTPQALIGGTQYWIGFINDSSVVLGLTDTLLVGYRATNTYASGAPATAPAMTSGQASWMLYGNLTGLAANWPQVDENPPLGDKSYNSSATVSQEDLFSFPALASTPTTIYTVAVKANVARTDAGARTINLRTKSGATTGNGSTPGISPPVSYGWVSSHFDLNPDTGLAWTAAGVNGAKHGIQIAT